MTEIRSNGPSAPLQAQTQRADRPRAGQTSPLPELPFEPVAVPVDNLNVVPGGSSLQSFDWIDQQQLQSDPFATVSAHFRVRDIDGLDQRSRADLHGQLDADVTLHRALLEHSVQLGNQQFPDFQMGISFEDGQYRIPIAYKTRLGNIGVGSITLRPEGGQLKVHIGGLAGGAAQVANFISWGTVRPVVDHLIQSLSRDMGFKVTSSSITDFTLEPDLQNSPVFREFPLAGGEKLKLESASTGNGSLVNLSTDANGDLKMSVKNLNVVASTAPGGPQAVPDAEGPDALDVQARGQLNRDMSSDIASNLDLSLDVREHEKAGLQQRIKAITGQDLPVSGKVSIQDLQVQSHIEPNGRIGRVESGGGRIEAEKLDLQLGTTQARLDSIKGGLNLERQGNITRLETDNVSLKGRFSSPQGSLSISNLALSGVLQHDQSRGQDLRFALAPGKSLEFSGQLSQGNQQIGIQGLSLRNAELQTKLAEGRLQLLGSQGKSPVASVQKLTLPGTDIRNIQLTGTLDAQLSTGAIDLDAKNFSLGGKVGDIRLDSLSGSGRFHVDPASGLQLEGATFRARGRAGEFGFQRLAGNGSLSVTPAGQVTLKEVNGLELVSDIGLNLNGSFKGTLDGTSVDLETIGRNPAKLDFRPKAGTPGAEVQLQGLSLKGAHLQGDLASGNFTLDARRGQALNATAASLQLPGITLKGLSMKGGQLQTDINGGQVNLRSLPGSAFDGGAKAIELPGVKLNDVTLKGGLTADTRTGHVSIDASSFSLQGQIGDLGLNRLKGAGKAQISPDGTIELAEARNIELETNIGLKLGGDFKGRIQGQTIVADTLGDKGATLSYQGNGLDLQGVQVQGHVETDFARQEFRFAASETGSLKVAKAVIGTLNLANIDMRGGALSYKPGEMRIEPLPNKTLTGGGQLDNVKISALETSGPVVYDMNKQEVRWEQPAKASLPEHGVQELRTDGPVSLQALPGGEIVFSSRGGTLNAQIGHLRLENLKTDGQVIYNPANGQLRFAGFDGKPLSVDGSFNGRPLKLSSSGQIQIEDTGSAFKISGQQIKMAGLVDGFTLDSQEGATASVVMRRDFSGFELQDLNFGFKLDDVAVDKGSGGIRTTPEGLEIKLNGALGADKGQLQALLAKLSSRQDFGQHFQAAMGQVNAALDKAFADFQNASLNFENLTIKLDHSGGLRDFTVDNNSLLHDARLEVDLYGKKKVLPMGDVTWTAQVQGDAGNVRIPHGHVAFALNQELRNTLAEEIKKQLEDSGLKKVRLEVEPSGKVKILNATYDGKLIDLSAKLEISTKIVNNQLEVSLDKVNLKNFLLNIVGKLANAPDKVADQVDTMLNQQQIKYQRRNSKGKPDPEGGRVFALDLQALLTRIDPGVTLKNASLDPQGNVQLDYSYVARTN